MTQQIRNKLMNLGIIISIILSIIGTIIYCIVTPHDNLFNVVTAHSKENSQVNIIIDEYIGKSSNQQTFNMDTSLPKSKFWTGLVNKPAKQEKLEQSGKEIYFTKNSKNLYFAYHIKLINTDKKDAIYDVTINGLSQTQTLLYFGTWSNDGFKPNTNLTNGVLAPKSEFEFYVIITPNIAKNQISKTISQNKNFNLTVTTTLDNQDK